MLGTSLALGTTGPNNAGVLLTHGACSRVLIGKAQHLHAMVWWQLLRWRQGPVHVLTWMPLIGIKWKKKGMISGGLGLNCFICRNSVSCRVTWVNKNGSSTCVLGLRSAYFLPHKAQAERAGVCWERSRALWVYAAEESGRSVLAPWNVSGD